MLISRSVLPIYPALSRGEGAFVKSHLNTNCSVVLLNEPYLYCHVVTSEDDQFGINYANINIERVYKDATYDEALKLLAQRTPAREYAAALEASRVSQSTPSQDRR